MTLHDIITSIMVRKGLTAAMEIRNYVQTADKDSVSKQAWLKARQNLNPEVFRLRNDYYMKNFYESKNEVKLWKDYLVLAIDGSKAEIPNSEENREYYGTQGNASCSGPARALLSGLFDVLNDFFLDLQICNVNKSELKAAEENINLRTRKLKNLQIEIEKYTLPVRKSKSQKRQFNKANKYACNLKPSF